MKTSNSPFPLKQISVILWQTAWWTLASPGASQEVGHEIHYRIWSCYTLLHGWVQKYILLQVLNNNELYGSSWGNEG